MLPFARQLVGKLKDSMKVSPKHRKETKEFKLFFLLFLPFLGGCSSAGSLNCFLYTSFVPAYKGTLLL